jgi:small subunit ribosomal protein S6
MKKKYEALLILNTKGNEESAKEIIERLEAEFVKDGATIEQVQKMGRHQFSYTAGKLDSGFYANFIFEAEPATIDVLKARLRLDEDVYQQHYKVVPKAAPAKARREKTPAA